MTDLSSASSRASEVARGPDWARDAVFYQVFPDRFNNGDRSNDPEGVAAWRDKPTLDNFFGGDLAGITAKLSHLERLGATALYLTPIFKAGTNHRYDTHDYREIDPMVGDLGKLRELVQEAHSRRIRVVLDGVFNHVGDGFWAFRDLAERGSQSAYRDWFFVDGLPLQAEPPNYQTCGGTHYLPKLNTAQPELREHLLQIAVRWLEDADIDGWRLDVPWKVPNEFWREFRTRVKQTRPDAFLVGEAWWSWGDLRDVFDGLMNYRLRARIFDFCVFDYQDAEDFSIEMRLLLDDSAGGDWMLNLLGSHDTARLLTVAGSEDKAFLALTALMTLPGTPMLYYGDEVGMEGGDDPDCRRAMEWEESRWNLRIFDTVRKLIALRHEHPALRRGSFELLLAFNRVLAFSRRLGDDEVLVILNPGHPRRDFSVRLTSASTAPFIDALTGALYPVGSSQIVVPELAGRSSLVLTRSADNAR